MSDNDQILNNNRLTAGTVLVPGTHIGQPYIGDPVINVPTNWIPISPPAGAGQVGVTTGSGLNIGGYPNISAGDDHRHWVETVDKVSEMAKEVMDILREKNAELLVQTEWLRKQIDDMQSMLKAKDSLIEKLVDQHGAQKGNQGRNGHSQGEEPGDVQAVEDSGSEAGVQRERAGEAASYICRGDG